MRLFNTIRVKVKCFLRKHYLMNQFCKKCGKTMDYDWGVNDEVWENVSSKYQNHVLCLDCFIEEYLKEHPECKHELDVHLYLL